MSRLALLVATVALLSGCGMFQKVFKHKTSEKTLTSSSKLETSEISLSVLDSSVTTVIERIDTAVQTKEVRGKGSKKLNLTQIKEGLNVIDDEFLTLNQKYDPIDSTLKTEYVLKPQNIKISGEKRTEIRNNIKTSKKESKNSSEESKSVARRSEAIVDRKPDPWAIGKIIFIIILVISLLIFARSLLIRARNLYKKL